MKVVLLILAAASTCPTARSTGLRRASNCFGLRLLPVLPRSREAPNVFYSPYSLSTAMGMIYAGSRDMTERELYSVLGYKSAHIAKDRVLEEHWNYAQSLFPPFHPMVSKRNAAVLSQSFEFLGDYLDDLRNAFDAHVMNVDFHKNGSRVVDGINQWIARETRGYIKHLFARPFPRSTMLVLLNIIYFKGIWQTRFEKSDTKSDHSSTMERRQCLWI
uniref:Putative serine proteinase inhibitor n=1 Tax=Rhipicephalus microplus TaxID=6941 RepID=A0A6G5A1N8_RHIMP